MSKENAFTPKDIVEGQIDLPEYQKPPEKPKDQFDPTRIIFPHIFNAGHIIQEARKAVVRKHTK